ncbi:CRISPR-associated endonuclease Cas2 [Oceanotoga sp. DSM 15011]|jgi:CRISPR-associated protein Cas2|uniref:CRISPR-associated endoribonuclease Cas2 n=1 Tax=Oceanotoga teriensis TaxID=515440 RepID=A0AA45HI33_9BACT|nr:MULTISPECIES: CRISPR-associated endonuclease Cas2 [Oceanotoga]MDO7977725.1 CRISPR-associated endonuclease Cas2 [Oceanotoga teriensis]PWJ90022.1 CRISPR-associated Cas2 family protein [Oceanotoga teriensis]UYP00551.1 CRISPR-associated endonuclease Cas2 [Oceanotoga sp. DSM 15011]
MSKNINYNYAILMYDINEKRVQKVFKICKKYLEHYQKSVFIGNITHSNLIRLKNEINNIIDESEDFVSIVKLYNESSFEIESFGNKENDDLIL